MALTISYPEALPVSARRDDIMSAIKDNQVVIVAGETGSGKTTQLPKMLLELGMGERGMIGHTQPRRLAARTVAERIAEELGTKIGEDVGFHVRFTGEVSRATKVKVMTDGILLAEIQRDKLLKKYNAIIIDEAHERSLNIDFLLGYLRRILPKRPDLKIVITSATIDPQRFAEHFAAPGPEGGEPVPAPIIEVSGRTFPVELRYRPLNPADGMDEDELDPDAQAEDRDPLDAIAEAVDELAAEPPGDILIFFPGEREIRDAAEVLRARVKTNRRLAGTEILPLFARLSLAEQHQVFNPGKNRRIVLATNVAETSLTVPGIKYVIDTGTARISRYSHRTKVQRLPIERVSQASANQRSGRCGRVSDGIAIRLYSQDDFESRPAFTDPEILRTNLAAVILQMSSMGVVRTARDVADFPFVQPPDAKSVNDGVALLRELGALNTGAEATITPVGKSLAQLPVDVRLGRMIVEAGSRGCAKEVMVLAAALSIQDPRERPSEETGKRERAAEMHKRFMDAKSDFSSLLNLWRYLQEKQKELSSSAFRRLCKNEFINYLRVREWQDLFTQLRQLARPLGIAISPEPVDPAANEDAIHISLLTGLLGHVGSWDERKREYVGARGTRFSVFPGSALSRKSTEWVMAAELVETSRLWARTVARLDPKWVEEVAGDLLKRSYSEPHWSRNSGAVMGYEKVTLFGLPIVPRRRIQYSKVDPELCRELFIRNALVEGDWKTHHKFFARNRRVLEDIEELETRMRRRDLRVSDEDLFEFYDSKLGPEVLSERHFDRWWKAAQHENPTLLDFNPEDMLQADATELDEAAFPRTWRHGTLDLDLVYEYNPAARAGESDGVSVRVPVLFLNQLDPVRFRWLIPGLRVELVTALIKSLPKAIRKNFVPAPDVARTAVAALEADFTPETDDLAASLELVLRRLKGVVIPPGSWNWEALPPHLRFTFTVVDSDAKILDESQDLPVLQQTLAAANRSALARSLGVKPGAALPTGPAAGTSGASDGKKGRGAKGQGPKSPAAAASRPGGVPVVATTVWERTGLTDWDTGVGINGSITPKVVTQVAGQQVTAYPALLDEKASVRLTVFRNPVEQLAAHRTGVIRLLLLKVPSPARYVLDHLNNQEKLVFTQNPHGSVASLIQDCTMAAVDRLVPETLPFDKAGFDALYERVRAELIDTVFAVTAIVEKVLSGTRRINKELKSASSLALVNALNDVKSQLEQLVYPGFVANTGYAQLAQLPRYIAAIEKRLEKLGTGHLARDNAATLDIQGLEDEYDAALGQLVAGVRTPAPLAAVKWMLEEYRVSLFAQELGTAYSVSAKRIRTAMREGLAAAK
ncbi:ATP-dependent RNA helicase HrpA [Paeniglutamicibacter sp. ABSL32-1]|uniref:ATP-dependent RNA helicase HrpA n=1 Tax=Paeniglutamicibacter quisquiliarum TaxID=2849498 RepID=UPI001C2DC141|nr:ATP-dependent RNA helicase HrpA [Paeniglutamicibacter quisquiliarum]MBV1779624.1 ATP-dependent RNA helicase HrpA [Paeniglutamicibacter quisquiliarum]